MTSAFFSRNVRQRLRDIAHQRPHALGVRELLVQRLLEIDRRLLEVVLQHEVVEVEDLAELGGKFLALEQVLHAHRAPRDLVFVRGADAAAGGADGVGAARRFARLVERTCDGRISGQLGETRSRANTSTPVSISVCASRNNASSDSTTPLPMRHCTFLCRIPEGMSDSTVFLPPMTSVWPALWPPWKRATAAARSVSRSTTLPLPSSPHWVPMMMTNLPMIARDCPAPPERGEYWIAEEESVSAGWAPDS